MLVGARFSAAAWATAAGLLLDLTIGSNSAMLSREPSFVLMLETIQVMVCCLHALVCLVLVFAACTGCWIARRATILRGCVSCRLRIMYAACGLPVQLKECIEAINLTAGLRMNGTGANIPQSTVPCVHACVVPGRMRACRCRYAWLCESPALYCGRISVSAPCFPPLPLSLLLLFSLPCLPSLAPSHFNHISISCAYCGHRMPAW